MAWLDDRIRDHPKLIDLSDAAFRYWIHVLCYCSEHRTAGHADAAIRACRVPSSVVTALRTRGLLDRQEDGHWVHDWAVYNDRRDASADDRREADRERQRRHRARARERKAREQAERVTDPSRDTFVTPSRDSHTGVSRARAGGRPNDHDHVQGEEEPLLEPNPPSHPELHDGEPALNGRVGGAEDEEQETEVENARRRRAGLRVPRDEAERLDPAPLLPAQPRGAPA